MVITGWKILFGGGVSARHEITLLTWPHAWQSAFGTSTIRQETSAQKQRFDIPEANDYVIDPRYAVPVSRWGQEGPAVRREGDRTTVIADDGEEVDVLRVRGGLARLYAQGTINDEMLAAGVDFQAHFAICGYDRLKTTDYSGAPGGGLSTEDRMTRTVRSRKIVESYLTSLGGVHTAQGLAAWWIVGHGAGLMDMSKDDEKNQNIPGSKDRAFWRGTLVVTLGMMAIHHRGRQKREKQAIRVQKRFDDDVFSCAGESARRRKQP